MHVVKSLQNNGLQRRAQHYNLLATIHSVSNRKQVYSNIHDKHKINELIWKQELYVQVYLHILNYTVYVIYSFKGILLSAENEVTLCGSISKLLTSFYVGYVNILLISLFTFVKRV